MEKELIPLINILFRCSPPAVATAIETHGLWGWDRYGRWGEFKPNSATCADALDALSEVHYGIVKSRLQDPPIDWQSVLTSTPPNPLHHLGWLKAQQPNFKKFENELAKTPAFKPLENHNLRPDTELAVIGVIVDLVTCKTPRIEGFESITQAKLIKNAVRLYGDLPGVSKANLEKVFRIALEHVETFGIETQVKK
jgi:hypothetical protein